MRAAYFLQTQVQQLGTKSNRTAGGTDWTGKTVALQDYPDNVKDFFRSGVSTNNAISASGVDLKKYRPIFLMQIIMLNGIIPTNRLVTQDTFNARVTYNVTDRLTADVKVTYLLQNIHNKPGVGGDGQVAGNIFRVPRSVSLADLKNYKKVDASGVETPTYWTSHRPCVYEPLLDGVQHACG